MKVLFISIIRYRVILFLLFSLLFFNINNISAQINVTIKSSFPIDSLFLKAQHCAYNDQKALARSYCRQILQIDSTFYDASVLIGRTYSWDKQYDSAKFILKQIINNKYGYYDAIDALIDVEFWSEDYVQSLKYAKIGLSFHPNNENFLYKKAKALNYSGDTKNASDILAYLLNINPSNKDASNLLFSIKSNKKINKVGISFDAEAFKGSIPWNFGSILLSRKTKLLGNIITRFNIAERFEKNGNQIEIDAYPVIRRGTYLYINTGYSWTSLYPKVCFTLEAYQKLPKAFEFSLGFRYMNFDNKRLLSTDSNMVMAYTGTIGKYYGNYWFSFRPYLTQGNKSLSKSLNLTARRYFGYAENYLSLTIGTGFSPDDHKYAFVTPENYFLNSQKISLCFQHKLLTNFISTLSTGIAQEEYYPGKYTNRFSFGVLLNYIF